jgi:prepilin peptidase CpaA
MPDTTPLLVLCALLTAGAISDLRSGRIPNLLTFPAILTGLIYHTAANGLAGLALSSLGLLSGIALLLVPYSMGGMGAGDVKLMGAVGSFLGASATFEAFLFTAIFGGVYALAVFANQPDGRHTLWNMVLLWRFAPVQSIKSLRGPRMKFGVAIAGGTIAYAVARAYGFTLFG